MDNEYRIDDVCKFLDEKDMKKVNSYIENYKPENGGLDMGVRIKVDDYVDKGNTRIIRKSTILGVSIIKKGNEENEIYPMGKMFTTDFETRHSDTTITMCVNFDEDFKTRIIDSGLYSWRFVIGINDMIPFLYESDGWMKDHIKKDKDDENVWCFTEPFNLPMKAGDTVKIKCVIMDIATTKERIIADLWKLNSDGKWVCVG